MISCALKALAALACRRQRLRSRSLRSSLVSLFILSVAAFASGCVSRGSDTKDAQLAGQLELARQFLQASRYTEAVGLLQSVARTHLGHAQAEYLLGMALLGLKDTQNAIRRFRAAAELSAELDDARVSLGFALIAESQLDEAESVLREVLERGSYPFMENVYVNLGLAQMERKRCREALREFDAAIQLDPTLVGAYFNRGKCLVRLGKVKLAAEAFEKAVRFCPGCAEPQLELARAQLRLGKRTQAQATLNELLETHTDDEVLEKAKRLLGRSTGQKRR